ncbi:hypothetical protein KT99_21004 [Shewanella benthica KT99]|uniref:Uncharacterized protein n=1 Tax=Shewanella benthica KT99 TaxID=314608 RepID=A9DLQ2_9GAMM|nr:hypothetical protein KT99_21004 [Shewanella benthica KT99]
MIDLAATGLAQPRIVTEDEITLFQGGEITLELIWIDPH